MAETGMVEKVARALCRANVCDWSSAELGGHSVEQMVDTTWQAYKPDARAAIEALREPTFAMRAAVSFETAEEYPAMIDTILKEEGNG